MEAIKRSVDLRVERIDKEALLELVEEASGLVRRLVVQQNSLWQLVRAHLDVEEIFIYFGFFVGRLGRPLGGRLGCRIAGGRGCGGRGGGRATVVDGTAALALKSARLNFTRYRHGVRGRVALSERLRERLKCGRLVTGKFEAWRGHNVVGRFARLHDLAV